MFTSRNDKNNNNFLRVSVVPIGIVVLKRLGVVEEERVEPRDWQDRRPVEEEAVEHHLQEREGAVEERASEANPTLEVVALFLRAVAS
jgi:hypothetical protein